MPNRGELPNPAMRVKSAAAAPDDAWPIVSFCALGFLISITMAFSAMGLDAVARQFGQFPFLG
jgi:hypothetical protein